MQLHVPSQEHVAYCAEGKKQPWVRPNTSRKVSEPICEHKYELLKHALHYTVVRVHRQCHLITEGEIT